MELSQRPHGAFPTLLLSSSPCLNATCWPPSRTRAQPVPVPQPRPTDCHCCGPTNRTCPSCSCTPCFPRLPWLLPWPAPTSPLAGWAMGVLQTLSWQLWCNLGSSTDTPKVSAVSGRLSPAWFLLPICHGAALTRPGHQGCCCPQDLKPRKIQAREKILPPGWPGKELPWGSARAGAGWAGGGPAGGEEGGDCPGLAGQGADFGAVRCPVLGRGAVPGTAPQGSRGQCPAPTGEGTLLGCPGRQRELPLPPGRATLPLWVQRRCSPLLPPGRGQSRRLLTLPISSP